MAVGGHHRALPWTAWAGGQLAASQASIVELRIARCGTSGQPQSKQRV